MVYLHIFSDIESWKKQKNAAADVFFPSACVVIFIIIYFLKVQMESFTGHQDHVQLGDIL